MKKNQLRLSFRADILIIVFSTVEMLLLVSCNTIDRLTFKKNTYSVGTYGKNLQSIFFTHCKSCFYPYLAQNDLDSTLDYIPEIIGGSALNKESIKIDDNGSILNILSIITDSPKYDILNSNRFDDRNSDLESILKNSQKVENLRFALNTPDYNFRIFTRNCSNSLSTYLETGSDVNIPYSKVKAVIQKDNKTDSRSAIFYVEGTFISPIKNLISPITKGKEKMYFYSGLWSAFNSVKNFNPAKSYYFISQFSGVTAKLFTSIGVYDTLQSSGLLNIDALPKGNIKSGYTFDQIITENISSALTEIYLLTQKNQYRLESFPTLKEIEDYIGATKLVWKDTKFSNRSIYIKYSIDGFYDKFWGTKEDWEAQLQYDSSSVKLESIIESLDPFETKELIIKTTILSQPEESSVRIPLQFILRKKNPKRDFNIALNCSSVEIELQNKLSIIPSGVFTMRNFDSTAKSGYMGVGVDVDENDSLENVNVKFQYSGTNQQIEPFVEASLERSGNAYFFFFRNFNKILTSDSTRNIPQELRNMTEPYKAKISFYLVKKRPNRTYERREIKRTVELSLPYYVVVRPQ